MKDRGQLNAHRNDISRPGKPRPLFACDSVPASHRYRNRIKDYSELQRVSLEQGAIRADNVSRLRKLYLNNPTNLAFECVVQGTIESSQTRHPQPFYLGLPCRRELAIEQRSLVRVMPKSRVRLEAGIDSLLFPGNQQLNVKVSSGSHTFKEQQFDFDVERGQFGGLETKLAFVGNQVSVEPAQIELSMVGRTPRTRMMVFHNNSNTTQSVSHHCTDAYRRALGRTETFQRHVRHQARRAKSIRLIIEKSPTETSTYGQLLVRLAGQASEPDRTEALPVALIYSPPTPPKLEVGELLTIASEGHTRFELAVTNHSEGYVPCSRTLKHHFTPRPIALARRWIRPLARASRNSRVCGLYR